MKTSTSVKHVSAPHSTTSSNLIKHHNFTTKQGINTKSSHLVIKKKHQKRHRATYIKTTLKHEMY